MLESVMEKPTPDEGVSIHDRLVSILEPKEPESVEDANPTQDTEEVEEALEEQSEGVEQEGEASEEMEAESADEDVPAESEPQLSTSELAQYLGIDEALLDVDTDGKVIVRTKVDGQEGTAKLQDLLRTHQIQGHLDNKTREVAEREKQLQQKTAELESQQQTKLQQLEDLSQIAWGQLTQEYKAVNWQALREEDPAEYAAKTADFHRREAELQQAFGQINAQRQAKSEQEQAKLQEVLAQEGQKLASAIPEWRDDAVAKKEREDIRSFALGLGYTDEDLSHVVDHRQVLILRDAMKYRQLQKSKPEVSKKVTKAPKLVKPGQAPTQQDRKSRELSDKRNAVKKTGGKGGTLAEYLLATGKV